MSGRGTATRGWWTHPWHRAHGLSPVIFRHGLFLLLLANSGSADAQSGMGIGLYPTGTETGFGLRTGKDSRWAGDLRVTRFGMQGTAEARTGSCVNEASILYRPLHLERIRLHTGLGFRVDWQFGTGQEHRYGAVMPIGVEAFPFPIHLAGLFFEAAPYCTIDRSGVPSYGVRTVAGFVCYIPTRER
ncbi:MAG: hypothetical protein KF905_09830 [Flavobacteriales bacterium]|nr:hypothetical protein [Flavobacteriales bacterium]